MTRDEIAQAMQDTSGADWGNEAHLQRFSARLKDQMIRDGWRQCAKGQRTTQFCAMAEGAVKAEREECARVCEDTDIVDFEHCTVLQQDAAKTLTNAAAAIRARGEA